MYWVIHVVGNSYYTYGYKTSKAARARFDKVQGGEVYIHQSSEADSMKAVDEFKADLAAGRRS